MQNETQPWVTTSGALKGGALLVIFSFLKVSKKIKLEAGPLMVVRQRVDFNRWSVKE